ncbi:Retrovirus-related Pol polyprotein from transposon TNT 1-94 [Senna tora]|uniref:Retrovirus-related Pol polyprotein from transposon TNT 1-94 n=1 Tax=Senna tora TaxID=362788 RepID=A0A834SPS0_9FABA|nr:Retrovirus-related Pol polyprotein from transposon TNT 1-94 [Senna tora]
MNGTNYDDWYESLDMYLTALRYDLAMREAKPIDLIVESTDAEKTFHKQWHDSNILCLTVLKYTVDKTIRQSVLEKDTIVEYVKAISEKFKKFDKSKKAYYISLLNNVWYDGVSRVREHMMKMVNYYNKLKGLKLDLGESFLVYKILESLPTEGLKNRRSPSERERTVLGIQGSFAAVESIGTVVLNIPTGHDLVLKNVIYVPSSRRMLISNSMLDALSYSFWQGNSRTEIYYNTIVVGSAKVLNGLYCLNLNPISESPSIASVHTMIGHKRHRIDENSSMLWHRHLAKIRGGKANRSKNILDLIHTDISGPITPATLAIELKSSKSIKAIRSNRGGVYYGRYIESGRNAGPFVLFLKEHEFLWRDTHRTTAYILNLVLRKSVENSPHELFTGKKPIMKYLRVWSCKAEVRLYNPQLKKMDLKTISGYCPGSRGNKFYCPSHSTRVIEFDRAYYFENDLDSGSEAPRAIKHHNKDTHLLITSAASSFSDMPSTSQDNRNDNIAARSCRRTIRRTFC